MDELAKNNSDAFMVEASIPSIAQPEEFPDLLTADEAIRFLRLDVNGPVKPELSLRRYRELGLLRGVKVGRHMRYLKSELLAFLQRKTDEGQHSP